MVSFPLKNIENDLFNKDTFLFRGLLQFCKILSRKGETFSTALS